MKNFRWSVPIQWGAILALALSMWLGGPEPVQEADAQQPRPFANVYQRPLSRLGHNQGVGAGSALPTLSNSNMAPLDAEIYQVVAPGTSNPTLNQYSSSLGDWQRAVMSRDDGQPVTFLDDDDDTYYGIIVPDDTVTSSFYYLPGSAYPISGAAAEDALANDLENVCYRAFLPYPMTITEAVVYEMQVASAGASDYLGVGIFEDADAGTQLTLGATVYAADGAALVINVTDVTLKPDFYRFCACQTDVSAQDWVGYAQDTGEAAVMNETVSELSFGLATNACTGSAVMPATTGAIASSSESLPLIKFQTN